MSTSELKDLKQNVSERLDFGMLTKKHGRVVARSGLTIRLNG